MGTEPVVTVFTLMEDKGEVMKEVKALKSDAGFKVLGTLVLKNNRADGSIEEVTMKNLIVNYGLVGLATVIAGGGALG